MNLGLVPPVPKALAIVCPRCHGGFTPCEPDEMLRCEACERRWPIVAGIPDLRVSGDPFLTIEEDRAAAVGLTARSSLSFPELLASYYDGNVLVPAAQKRAIIRATLAAPERALSFLKHAERLLGIEIGPAQRILDIGAGTGPLSVELARRGADVWAVDIGLRWAAFARARAEDADVSFNSLCAGISNLPFPDASFDLVLGESVLELVPDQQIALRELHRVLRPGAHLVFSTPNRWFPGPDPHTGVPFTSWLPQSGVTAVARMRGILPPTRTLLSRVGLRRLLKLAGFHQVAIDPPEIPASLVAGVPAWMRAGIAAYRRAVATPGLRRIAAWVAPMHIAAAQRPRANVR